VTAIWLASWSIADVMATAAAASELDVEASTKVPCWLSDATLSPKVATRQRAVSVQRPSWPISKRSISTSRRLVGS